MYTIFDAIGNENDNAGYPLDEAGYKKERQVTPQLQCKPSPQPSRELTGGWSASNAHAKIDDSASVFDDIGRSY